MDLALDPMEIRVLGCLIEKQITTPEYYPLTLNALVAACNQTTNREPVTIYEESTVEHALEGLRQKGLIWVVRGGRAHKFEHRLGEKLKLPAPETAVLCVLMLRGPQTAGEIRARTGRLHTFASLDEVETAIASLSQAEPPRVEKLPRLPGSKEHRFAHRLGGETQAGAGDAPSHAEPSAAAPHAEDDRVARLEGEVASLRQELDDLRRQLHDLKSQLE